MLKRYLLAGLILLVLVGCKKEEAGIGTDDFPVEPTASYAAYATESYQTKVRVDPSATNTPTGIESVAPTSLLMVIDESASVRTCSLRQQKMRHSVPEFFMALKQNIPSQNLRIAVSMFNAENPYHPIISFNRDLKNSTNWFQEIEEIKLSNTSWEDFSTPFKMGLQDLKSTSAQKQFLLFITDGIYDHIDSVYETINNTLDYSNQKIFILVLCPDQEQDNSFWNQIDKDKDLVTVFRTNSPDWLRDLTKSVVGDYLTEDIKWVTPNEEQSFEVPGDYNFKVTAISLFQGNIGIRPEDQNLNQDVVPNSFYYYQNAEPAANCEFSRNSIVNYTDGDVLFWINKEKLEVHLRTEFVSNPNEKPVLATIMTIPQKSNADLINLLSCYKPLVTVKKNPEKLVAIPPEQGYCLDGWCAEPFRLVSYWSWNKEVPPIIDSFAILDRKTLSVVHGSDPSNLVPPPYIHKFSISGPYTSESGSSDEPYLVVDFWIWSDPAAIQDVEIRAFTDLNASALTNVGNQRKKYGNTPLCPYEDGQTGYYQVREADLSNNNQIVVRKFFDNSDFSYILKVKIFRMVGWHTQNDGDNQDDRHCDYYKFHLVFKDISWECDMKQFKCTPKPEIQ